MKTILIVANKTIAASALLERVREKAGDGKARIVSCVPREIPKYGNVIYADAVYDAARVKIDLVRAFLRADGIDAIGEVGDPDPYSATMDAIAEYNPDEIIISTLPTTSSGWQRRDLVDRVRAATRIPVEHVEADIDSEGIAAHVTLVVAARTASGEELFNHLTSRTADKPQAFIIVVPQEGGEGIHTKQARARLNQVLDRVRSSGLLAAGIIGDPDPYTATMNALDLFRIDDIVISTLPATRSGWMRADLVDRVRKASNKPVDHVEAAAPAVA